MPKFKILTNVSFGEVDPEGYLISKEFKAGEVADLSPEQAAQFPAGTLEPVKLAVQAEPEKKPKK